MEQNTLETLAQREQALLEREEALAARERQAALTEGLRARGLPDALSALLTPSAPEQLNDALDTLRDAWDSALTARVTDRLRAHPPAASGALPPAPDERLRRLRAAMGLSKA